MDRKIDFLIIGAQKSGTTTLYHWLKQHPDIFLPEAKEILYFAKDEFYQQGDEYLNVFYRHYGGQKIAGGAYVHMIYFPYVAERIYSYNPQIKFIALLRNPVDRAYSAYWFARCNGWETIATLEDALDKEEKRVHGPYKDQAELTYLAHGRYAEQLQSYFNLFGRDRVMVLLTEELRDNSEKVVGRTLNFLGLPSNTDSLDLSRDSNRAATARFPWLQKIFLTQDVWYKKWGRKALSPDIRSFIRERVSKKVILLNRRPFQYPPMDPSTRRMLVEHFKPYNEQLGQLIGRDLSFWNQ